jgi:hypothetical protein
LESNLPAFAVQPLILDIQTEKEVATIVCEHCREEMVPNPRCKNQRYCGKKACQRARKTAWEKEKMATDKDYRDNRQHSRKTWADNHPDYWKGYRKRNPDKALRNRLLQQLRRRKKSGAQGPAGTTDSIAVAKMDALKTAWGQPSQTFWLVPKVAKMDALEVQVIDVMNRFSAQRTERALPRRTRLPGGG